MSMEWFAAHVIRLAQLSFDSPSSINVASRQQVLVAAEPDAWDPAAAAAMCRHVNATLALRQRGAQGCKLGVPGPISP